jgi:hypothetical protein
MHGSFSLLYCFVFLLEVPATAYYLPVSCPLFFHSMFLSGDLIIFRPMYFSLLLFLPRTPPPSQSGPATCLTLFRHRDPHPRGAATTAGAFRAFDFDAPLSPFDHYAQQTAAQRSAAVSAAATSDGIGNSSGSSGDVSRGAAGAIGSAGALTAAAVATDLVRQIVRAICTLFLCPDLYRLSLLFFQLIMSLCIFYI